MIDQHLLNELEKLEAENAALRAELKAVSAERDALEDEVLVLREAQSLTQELSAPGTCR